MHKRQRCEASSQPDEIWKVILRFAMSIRKNIVPMRLTCKKWNDMIEEILSHEKISMIDILVKLIFTKGGDSIRILQDFSDPFGWIVIAQNRNGRCAYHCDVPSYVCGGIACVALSAYKTYVDPMGEAPSKKIEEVKKLLDFEDQLWIKDIKVLRKLLSKVMNEMPSLCEDMTEIRIVHRIGFGYEKTWKLFADIYTKCIDLPGYPIFYAMHITKDILKDATENKMIKTIVISE